MNKLRDSLANLQHAAEDEELEEELDLRMKNIKVVFDEGGSFILNISSGMVTKVDERSGAYVFDVGVQQRRKEFQRST